jgi:predicted ABC-type ATPase
MPDLIVVAGPNGAGKSTAAPFLLQGAMHVDNFVNADVIAQGLCAYQPETAAISAGRIMLDRIHALADARANFAFETTLSSRTFSVWIPKLKKQGYRFHLVFLWLESVELAIFRVAERVRTGGHTVPEETIRRRYMAGVNNFFGLYSPLADFWQLYDNSNLNQLTLIASKTDGGKISIENELLWKQISETFDEEKNRHPQ